MMLIKSILLLIVSTILIVKGQDGNVYINVIPYTDSKCEENVGFGISGLLYACFTLDEIHNWVFTSSSNEVTVTGYNNNETEVCDESASLYFPTRTFMLDSCISGNILPHFDFNVGSIESSTTPAYYRLTKTQAVPSIPSNSYTRILTYAQCSSDNFKENTVVLEYFTNGTTVYYGTNSDQTFQAFCNNDGIAESINCFIDNCGPISHDSETCGIIGPFFNSSADGSNSGGSNSGSASASSLSSSGFQININGDKNNRFSFSSTGSGSISSESQSTGSGSISSESQSSWQSSSSQQATGYYQSVYCTQ